MDVDSTEPLDPTDWRVLAVLQADARVSFADLARQVGMSASAVTERVRRLEERGIIEGYRAAVPPEKIGLEVLAFVRLRYPNGNYRPFESLLATTPEILEAHHVTGDDCFILKVAARSMRHLEEVAGRIGGLGSITTNVVYSTPLPARAIEPATLGAARSERGGTAGRGANAGRAGRGRRTRPASGAIHRAHNAS
jgi:Lrp/AsnC family transcriptional regulator, leucine-responsive regulatory protein